MTAAATQSVSLQQGMDPMQAPKDYAFVREWSDAVRLGQQHWIWSYVMDENYPLHPTAQALISPDNVAREPIYIADVGCGNGTWLFDMYRKTPYALRNRVFFTGTDLSPEYLPQPGDMPQTMSFSTLDVYGDIPPELVEKFDVVHVRMFAIVVKNNDPTSLLKNVMKMLKPNGIIQWDELAVSTCRPSAPSKGVSTMATEAWIKLFMEKCDVVLNTTYKWVPKLSEYFEQVKLQVIDSVHRECPQELRRVMTSNTITASENIARSLVDDGGSSSKWEAMLVEVNQGVSVIQDMVMVVGRKPPAS